MKRYARHSYGPDYPCVHDWPADCFVQCGGSEQRQFFFEAFPTGTMLRGDAPTIAEAEDKAWRQYQRLLACDRDHNDPENFDPRGYRNGVGFCKSCGMFKTGILPLLERCCVCNEPTYHGTEGDKWYCRTHWANTETAKQRAAELAELQAMTAEDLAVGLMEVLERIVKKETA